MGKIMTFRSMLLKESSARFSSLKSYPNGRNWRIVPLKQMAVARRIT